MPPRKPVESLENMCFMLMAQTIHCLAVELEEEPGECQVSLGELSQQVASLPPVINNNMITKVIETIHQTVSRTRRNIGMRTCLQVLLQPHIQRLDLNGLFFKMRLPGSINTAIREVVGQAVRQMSNLVILKMVSKCSDDILCTVSKHCPALQEVNVSISDLVTDKGMEALAQGCSSLHSLEIYKCWEVTEKGIAYVLQHADNLCKLRCDFLGNVIITKFKRSKKKFKLTHFEQTQALFMPKPEEVEWLGCMCPQLETASLFVKDATLALVPQLGSFRILEIEASRTLGEGFVQAFRSLGSSLQTLQLSCNEVDQEKIVLLGQCCPQLTTLHISTAAVVGSEKLTNPGGHLFSSLTTLHLQVWREECGLSRECVEFFLLWCLKLESLVLKAQLGFLDDPYLDRLLVSNPLSLARQLIIASDRHVPLTVRSVHRLLASCPALESLAVSSWNVTEEEFFRIRDDIRKNNYNLSLS